MEKNKHYQIKYLPIARKDLQEIVDYIAFDLEVPEIAIKMLNTLETEILTLRENPFRGSIYSSNRKHDFQYRKLFVKNYVIFYLILDDAVEIQRVFYNRRNMDKLI
jgi:addiction module RelE/StbE family toxin